MSETKNLWGGRFTGQADAGFVEFNRSFGFDRRLFACDVRASIAHCHGLREAGILNHHEADAIEGGLNKVLQAGRTDESYFAEVAEDIHSFVESKLIELIGDIGRKLHTGRSRNDQVATDLRLWLREELDHLDEAARNTQQALLELATANSEAVIPGYTHLQRAQPLVFAHWCLAYFEMLARDRDRLADARKRVNQLPLGSAALAGTSYPIDRAAIAHELDFDGVTRNSADSVSDRDFCVEFVSACALIMVHLSRFAEDVILYSSMEFGFFELSDAVATGSSIMPQKKNPDSMELVRGKAGRVFGANLALLTMLKALPLSYNKDMQEDKEAVFDAADTTRTCLQVTATVIRNIKIRAGVTLAASSSGHMNATELADYLSRKGVSFREAHAVVGRAVLRAIERNVELQALSLEELRQFSPKFESDVFNALTLESTLATKSQIGGTSRERVNEALVAARASLER